MVWLGLPNYVRSVVWFQHLEKPKGDVHVRFGLGLGRCEYDMWQNSPKIWLICVESASTLICATRLPSQIVAHANYLGLK